MPLTRRTISVAAESSAPVSAALFEHGQSDDHGGILFLFHDRRRVVVHIDDVVGVGDLHALGKRLDSLVLERLQNGLAAADQYGLAAKVLRGLDRTERDLIRGVVAAHGVYEYSHSVPSCPVI